MNPWFRPRESSGAGATGNGRVRNCRDNIARRFIAMPKSRDGGNDCQQQSGRGVRLGSKSNKSKLVNASRFGMSQSCCQALPKGKRSSCLPRVWGHTDTRTAGVVPGTNLSVSGIRNMVNLLASFPAEGKLAARRAEKSAGKGSWRKQMPSCNRMDRSGLAPCESRPLPAGCASRERLKNLSRRKANERFGVCYHRFARRMGPD